MASSFTIIVILVTPIIRIYRKHGVFNLFKMLRGFRWDNPPSGINVTSNRTSESIEFHQGKSNFGEMMLETSSKWTTQLTKIVSPVAIIMSIRAPVGDVNLLIDRSIVIGRGLSSIQPYCSDIYYFYYLLSTKKKLLESMATGTTFKAINNKTLQEIILPIAPEKEQKRIVAVIEKMLLEICQFG